MTEGKKTSTQDGYRPGQQKPNQIVSEGYMPSIQGGHRPAIGSGVPVNPPNQGTSGKK